MKFALALVVSTGLSLAALAEDVPLKIDGIEIQKSSVDDSSIRYLKSSAIKGLAFLLNCSEENSAALVFEEKKDNGLNILDLIGAVKVENLEQCQKINDCVQATEISENSAIILSLESNTKIITIKELPGACQKN